MSYNLNTGIRSGLLANASLAALVVDRVTLEFYPAGAEPAGPWIVMHQISGNRPSAHDGDAGLKKARYQFTIGGTNKDQCDAVRAILSKQFNAVNYNYVDGVTTYVLTFFFEDERDGWEEKTRLYRPSVDLTIWVAD